MNVLSKQKLITSGKAPTTANLAKGELAFGMVSGENKLYGNTGTEVVELGGGGSSSDVNSENLQKLMWDRSDPIFYFNTESAYDLFRTSRYCLSGGWYAAIADSTPTPTEIEITMSKNDGGFVNTNNDDRIKIIDDGRAFIVNYTGTIGMMFSAQTATFSGDSLVSSDGASTLACPNQASTVKDLAVGNNVSFSLKNSSIGDADITIKLGGWVQ